MLCVIPVRKIEAERPSSCLRQIHVWLCNSMLMNVLRNFATTAGLGHTIFILQADVYNACMSTHTYRMMTSPLFTDVWFTKHLYILLVIKFMILISYFI